MRKRSALIIANPATRVGRKACRLADALATLARHDYAIEHHVPPNREGAVETTARLARDYAQVIAAGGDGTVSAVAAGLATVPDSPPLAIWPLGTGNDVARQVGVGSLDAALRVAVDGTPSPIDLIEIVATPTGEVRVALSFAAFGFAAELLRGVTPRLKRWTGRRWAYWIGLVPALRRYRPLRVRVATSGLEFWGPVFHVAAGNFEAVGGGRMRLSPGAQPNDGQLEFCVIRSLAPGRVLRCLHHLVRGTHPRLPEVQYVRGTEMRVDCDGDPAVAWDGDVFRMGSACLRVRPNAIRLMVPPGPCQAGRS